MNASDDRDLWILELADEGWPVDDIAALLVVSHAYVAKLIAEVAVDANREGVLQ